MLGLKELKEREYGAFIKWLEANNIRDSFSNDVWAFFILQRLHQQYLEQMRVNQLLQSCPENILQRHIDGRKATASPPN